MNQTDIVFDKDKIYIKGELNIHNVMDLYARSLNLFKNNPALIVDLSQLTSSDSAGLALIIEWTKLAKHHNQSIQIQNIPQNLLSITKAADMEKLLNL